MVKKKNNSKTMLTVRTNLWGNGSSRQYVCTPLQLQHINCPLEGGVKILATFKVSHLLSIAKQEEISHNFC